MKLVPIQNKSENMLNYLLTNDDPHVYYPLIGSNYIGPTQPGDNCHTWVITNLSPSS